MNLTAKERELIAEALTSFAVDCEVNAKATESIVAACNFRDKVYHALKLIYRLENEG